MTGFDHNFALLPDALGLQAVGDFLRHVGFVCAKQMRSPEHDQHGSCDSLSSSLSKLRHS